MIRGNKFELHFEQDVMADEKIRTLIQQDATFAQELYASICNLIWVSPNKNEYTASWRSAGDFVATVAGKGEDYLDYYCSGGEGKVSARVENEMKRIGWSWKRYKKDSDM